MYDVDRPLFDQAVQLANTGQTRQAYSQFYFVRSHGNNDIELLFWLADTTPFASEARFLLGQIALREPTHPSLPFAWSDYNRKLGAWPPAFTFRPPGPVMRCPYCNCLAPVIVKKEVSTAGWVVFALFLIFTLILFWVGLLIDEERRYCVSCGDCNSCSGGEP